MTRTFVAAVAFGAVLIAGCQDKSTKAAPPAAAATTSSAGRTTLPNGDTADIGPPPRVVTPLAGTESK